jgi:D-alanine-D-alanine ligase
MQDVRGYKFGKIGVLMGGPSTEREISLKSGKAVYESLKEQGLDVIAIDIKTDDLKQNSFLISSKNIDCAFIALHGRFGEDGQIQTILDRLKIPYTGSGAKASMLAMDKIASRKIFQEHGLNVPRYIILERSSFNSNQRVYNELQLPWVIKPATHGSSIGLSIIDRSQDLDKALELAFGFDERVIIEEYIEGRELTVGILQDRALSVIEICPKKRFFDFQAKYEHGMTQYFVPAQLDKEITHQAQEMALLAHRLLGCFGFSRVDMMLNRKNILFVLELNTIPGLTSTSLLPKAARVEGIDFGQLCLRLLKLADERK